MNNLPDDPDTAEDDVPVKVSYHTAPVSDETEESDDQNTVYSVIASKAKRRFEEASTLGEQSSTENSEIATSSMTEVGTPRNDIDEKSEIEEDPLDNESESKPDNSDEPEAPAIDPNLYYLQTVKAGKQPEWQLPNEELNVFSNPIDDGLIQYFAYPKGSEKTADDVPNAEAVANKNKSANSVIIIDQVGNHLTLGCCLELILAKNGHALAKTDSNLDNLEANITSLIDLAKVNFGVTVEHFISTPNVSSEVESRLDDLEDAEEDVASLGVASGIVDRPILAPKSDRSKMAIFIPILVLIVIVSSLFFFRDKIMSKISNITNPPKEAQITPTPILTPTPSPVITVDRSKYTVRVLNGTLTTGAAGVLAEKLKALGWLIDKTGNATSSAIVESFVRGKVNVDDAIAVLIADVTDYQASSSSATLKSNDKANLEFVIGKK